VSECAHSIFLFYQQPRSRRTKPFSLCLRPAPSNPPLLCAPGVAIVFVLNYATGSNENKAAHSIETMYIFFTTPRFQMENLTFLGSDKNNKFQVCFCLHCEAFIC
jgi:hypothetical protein